MDLSEFICLGCGACCRQDGYVRLKKNEPDKIAAFLRTNVYDFIETYTILTRDRQALSLKDKKNGECIFLSSHGCRINAVKPEQCLGFPHQWKFKAFKNICAWARNNN
ncbi:MAG: YkgJ family cysteine cluster protein [Pseudomonadota bacterium]